MTCEVLDIFWWNPLLPEISDGHDSNRMRRQAQRQPGIAQPTLEHPPHIIGTQRGFSGPLGSLLDKRST